MIKLRKIRKYLLSLLLAAVLLPICSAQAVCPVCTIAVGAGIGLSRYLGIDDTVTGTWIGGLILSMSFWTEDWLEKKGWGFRYKRIILLLAYYAVVLVPLYWKDIIGHPFNKLFGTDKIILGTLVGSVSFFLGTEINLALKKRNGGKVYFPFQKVVTAIAPLIILSAIFYIITKR
jgi:hypothetical protein